MRKLNECRAEVFRRSNERIKERRRIRNRVFAGCVMLCLIIAVWSVAGLPIMLSGEKDTTSGDMTGMTGGENVASILCAYTEAEIRSAADIPKYYETVTDKAEVAEIFLLICSFFEGANIQDNGENHIIENHGSQLTGYTVTFTAENGSKTVYNINRNILFNVSKDEKIILTDAGLAELMTAIGISEYGGIQIN